MLTDLAVVTSSIVISKEDKRAVGFHTTETSQTLNFDMLAQIYQKTPGLVMDKLKHVLEFSWDCINTHTNAKGVIFAYDEAQNMSDRSDKNEFPLSLMLDVFQSIQKKNIPMMLVLAGLPTLFPKLVEARTFAERMFRVLFLDSLAEDDSKEAIKKPIEQAKCGVILADKLIADVVRESGGYPYFIQFICREVYDAALQKHTKGQPLAVSLPDITRKLDSDFFAGRWAKATDRQRELLHVVAQLDNCDGEFTAHETVTKSVDVLDKPFSASHVSQMFLTLAEAGLIYKNRHGKYSFAVPLLGKFIRRQEVMLKL